MSLSISNHSEGTLFVLPEKNSRSQLWKNRLHTYIHTYIHSGPWIRNHGSTYIPDLEPGTMALHTFQTLNQEPWLYIHSGPWTRNHGSTYIPALEPGTMALHTFQTLNQEPWLYSPSAGLDSFFSFLILYTVGRAYWTGDRPIAKTLLPTQNNTNTNIHTSQGIRNHHLSVRAGENSSCLKLLGHCHRLICIYKRNVSTF
jgi:hypothetical protein